MAIFIELGALLVALLLLYLLLRFLKEPLHVLANSLLGLIIFGILNLFGLGIPINIISIAVVGVSGILGVILVLMLHFLGLGF